MVYKFSLQPLPEYLYIKQHGSTENDFESLAELLRKIPSSKHMATYISPLLISLYFTEFLSAVSLNSSSNTANGSVTPELPPPLRQALSFIQQNYNKKLSTEQICEHCHLSPQHMIRLFKQHLV